LLPLGGLGLLLGGVPPDVDGDVDRVGQFVLASITDPSGHVLVVGDVGGVNVCLHDGSFGFFVQSTGGGVPVQLFTHVEPVPDPPDDGIDVLLGCNAADDVVVLTYGHVVLSLHVDGGDVGIIPCSFAS
jgi:hypothetical protein